MEENVRINKDDLIEFLKKNLRLELNVEKQRDYYEDYVQATAKVFLGEVLITEQEDGTCVPKEVLW